MRVLRWCLSVSNAGITVFVFVFVFVFVVLVSACSQSDGGGTGHSFTISSEYGVTTAWNENGPRTLGNIFRFEPILRLQQDPDNEESLLFGPNEFTMDQEGNFYVSDARNSRIAVFNHRGEYVRAFGREGQGPGEFIFMSNLLIQGDVVSAYDFRMRRRTFYRTDGTLIKVVTVPATVLVIPKVVLWTCTYWMMIGSIS